MRIILIAILISNLSFGKENLFQIEPKKDQLPIRCEVVNENKDALTYAVGGFLVGTILWGFFYYQRNKK